MLRALRLGRLLVKGSVGVLAKAALFLAIVGFAWPTCGGRQCWKMGFPAGGSRRAIARLGALGEGVESGNWKVGLSSIKVS